jgi:hypothetical protein
MRVLQIEEGARQSPIIAARKVEDPISISPA